MFLFRHTSGGMVCCFVEVDNGTMNQKQIRAKYRRYVAWSQSPTGKQYLTDLYRRHGATEPRPTFRLLVVARSRTGRDDPHRMLELSEPIVKLPAAMQDRFWFTTVAALRSCQDDLLPLDAANWRRGRDVDHLRKMLVAGSSRRGKKAAPRPDCATSQLHKLFPECPARVSTNSSQSQSVSPR